MTQDSYQKARERWDDAVDGAAEERRRMIEDLKFSNPVDPEQWDDGLVKARLNDPGGARPTYVFDQTNQYIAQVVNDSRMNKPQIQTVPASSGANEKVSEALDGIIRQIEYSSAASIAYDTAQEQAARIGLGWFRIVPKVVESEYNAQDIRILRVHDPLAVRYDPSFTSPDGSDQTFGFIESIIPKNVFLKTYPKRKKRFTNWSSDDDGWYGDDERVRICEYFEQVEEKVNRLVCETPDGSRKTVTEDEYWEASKRDGYKMPVIIQFESKTKSVKWSKMDGDDYLEDTTDFPSQWIPLIPVIGYEIWIEGKRHLCGMVRRMRSSQQAYNMERSAEIEWMASQPKAPYIVPWEAVANHQQAWGNANTSNQAMLPYDHVDSNGQPLPPPQRLAPPSPGAAFQNMGQKGLADLQASIGMYRANLGAPSNETSGIAIRRREQQGDTANFHYVDNLARSMTHAGRIIIDMIPRLYDEEREARILGLDGKSQPVTISPDMTEPVRMNGKKIAAINLTTGMYDVRCKVGPAYASLREETADALTKIVQSNPALMTVLGPMWARMQDWPEAEHLSKILLAMAPPPVQAIESENEEMTPQMIAKMQQLKQQVDQAMQQKDMQIQQLSGALQNAAHQHQQAEQALQQKSMDQSATVQKASIEMQTGAEVDIQKARIDAAAKIVVAQINAQAKQQIEAQAAQVQAIEVATQPVDLQPIDPQTQQPVGPDFQMMMAEAMDLLSQTIAATSAPKPPMQIMHQRDPATGLITASYEMPMDSAPIQ